MSNMSQRDEVVFRFLEDNPDVRDLIYEIATMREEFDFTPEQGSVSPSHTKESIEESLRQRKRRYAARLIPAAIGLAGKACGREARVEYVQSKSSTDLTATGDNPRAQELDSLARRIQLLDFFLPETGREGEITIRMAVAELAAISRGDDPRHFAKIDLGPNSRRRGNAWRVAHLQALALMWDAYFRAEGLAPKEVNLLVGNAFGELHTTYIRWRDPVRKELGWQFDLLMGQAERYRHRLAEGLEDAKEKLKADGQRYRAERRIHAEQQ